MSSSVWTIGSFSASSAKRGSLAMASASLTGLAGLLRHHLRQLIDLAIGHLQHAADVAQHGAGLQRTEGDDLANLVAAVFLLDVADHLFAAILAEVDVEVGHRDAVRVEEALEQQGETQADRYR